MRKAQLAVAPMIASNQVSVIDIAGLRVQLYHMGDATPFVDTLVHSSQGQTEFDIQIPVPIAGESETLLLSLALLDQQEVVVYRPENDPTTITVVASSEPTPVSMPLEYVGPGAAAVFLEMLEHNVSVRAGETVRLSAVARDAAGNAIADARIGWLALDPLVTIDDARSGVVRAGQTAGTARVLAMLPRIREGAPSIEDTALLRWLWRVVIRM
jgi:hypothetical protein